MLTIDLGWSGLDLVKVYNRVHTGAAGAEVVKFVWVVWIKVGNEMFPEERSNLIFDCECR